MYEKYEFEIPGIENPEASELFVLDLAMSDGGETIGAVNESQDSQSVAETEESSASSEYMTVFPSGYENVPENATMLERLKYGGKVTLIGMTTVFLVLILIWAICALMGKIFGSVGQKEQSNSANENAVPQQPTAPVRESAPVASADYSTVAVVASAAIAAYRGEDTVNFNISSIRPCGNGAVALAPEVVAQIAASIACLEGKDTVDFTISSIRII